jgi:predicted lactoylglutathione lyase
VAGMATIDYLTVEVAEPTAAEEFYTALGVRDRVGVRAADGTPNEPSSFALSLVVSQPADVDSLLGTALEAGAVSLKPAKRSLWGYGGVVQAPDGTTWTVASSTKKNTGPATGRIDELVLQLGASDVAASKQFYVDRGFTVAKSYGRKYVELDTGPVKLTLNNPRALAKVTGITADGTTSHRLRIGSGAGPFTDPDGFTWEATSA